MLFLLAAGMRWNHWQARNALLVAAAFPPALVTLPSSPVIFGFGALYIAYFVAFYVHDTKRLFASEDARAKDAAGTDKKQRITAAQMTRTPASGAPPLAAPSRAAANSTVAPNARDGVISIRI
jgi:hypothetical protein